MTNHNNTATLCEIRNSVKIFLGLVSRRPTVTQLNMEFSSKNKEKNQAHEELT